MSRRTRPGSVGEGASVIQTGFREGGGVKAQVGAQRSRGQQASYFLKMSLHWEISNLRVLVGGRNG